MDEIDLDKHIAELEAERSVLLGKKLIMDEQLLTLHKLIQAAKNERDNLLIADKKFDWEWLLHEDGMTSDAKYRECQRSLELFGLSSSGYLPEIQQRCVQVALYHGDPGSFEKAILGLKAILPFLKKNTAGLKYIKVLEYSLSASGSFGLTTDDVVFNLEHARGYRINNLKSFDSLESAISYIQEHHYYEKVGKYEDDAR